MKQGEMLLKLEKLLQILVKRKSNLEAKLWQIDNLPNEKITKDTYRQWHEVYCKITYLDLRIEGIKAKMDMLANKDIVRDVISSSKGLFNYLRRAN